MWLLYGFLAASEHYRCVSSAVTALEYAEGGPGISGVSLTLDTVFHNPARRRVSSLSFDFSCFSLRYRGARLRFVNTTLAAVGGMTSCRCQVRVQTMFRSSGANGRLGVGFNTAAARRYFDLRRHAVLSAEGTSGSPPITRHMD